NKGIRTLQNAGRIGRAASTDFNAQNRALNTYFIRHALLISQVRAAVSIGARHTGFQLIRWREDRGLLDRVEIALDPGYVSQPVAPDAFFSLQDPKARKLHFFLEADRGTMTIARFMLKLRAYAVYFQEKKHTAKYGIEYFRVLSVLTETK